MLYLGIALVIALVSVVPALQARSFGAAFLLGAIYTFLGWWIGYSSAVGFAGPMFGAALVSVAALSSISASVAISDKGDSASASVILPIIAWILSLGIPIYSSGMFNADRYRMLVGDMEKRVWTQDIQPKDPQHFRAVSAENALYLARKAVGELGTIGSQFQVSDEAITLQVIRDELWYIIPLDFTSWRAWNNADTAIGYIMIHAEDPNHQPIVRQLPKEKQFAYTPGAWFGNDLIRHIRLSGNLRANLSGVHLEIDDNDNPWWITTVLEPTIGQFGNKVQGVLITNPVTGESQFAKLGEVPVWVDRVMPRYLTKEYLAEWGEYVHGWMNSWWEKKDLTEPENPSLIFSSEHSPMFVTGITSQNQKDDSLIGIVYTNTRTGKSVFYEVKGGATDEAVSYAVAKFQDVQFKKLHPADPQVYNLYGTMASIVPLVNENHAYSGVAIAHINNVQQIAVGRTLSDAVRQYQQMLGQTGSFANLEKAHAIEAIEGVIARIKQDLTQNGATHYMVLEGGKRAFVGGTGQFPMLPLAQAGDRVKIEYFASEESVVPLHAFNNLTLVLEKGAAEATADVRKQATQVTNEAKPVRRDLGERLKAATPEELRKIEKALGK